MDSSSSTSAKILNFDYWQDLSYRDKIDHLFATGHVADVKFIVGADYETSEVIHGHKFMFMLVSPVFERMFNSQFVETHRSTEIRLRDVEPQDFKNFRFMIYNNDITNLSQLSFADIVKVYRLCDQYLVKSITQHCITHMWSSLDAATIDNLIIMYGFARDLDDKDLLMGAVKEKIKLKEEKIAKTLDDLPEHAFYEYIKFLSQLAGVSAVTLLNAINSYFEANNLLPVKEIENVEENIPSNALNIPANASEVVANKPIDAAAAEQVPAANPPPAAAAEQVPAANPPPAADQPPAAEKPPVVVPISDAVLLRPKTTVTLLNNLFELINFTTITPKEFIDGPGKLQIISTSKKYEILAFLYTKNHTQKKIPQKNV